MSIAMDFPLEAADPHCLTLGTAGALLAEAPWRRLVVVGDSIAQGVREPVTATATRALPTGSPRALPR
jgi:hypothetical protein